jgi:hypothetical protein
MLLRDDHRDWTLEALEPRALLAADLSLAIGSVRIDDGGDRARVAAIVTNAGDLPSAAGARVAFFLSRDATLDATDIAAGMVAHDLPSLRPGRHQRLEHSFQISRLIDPAAFGARLPDGEYFIIATIHQDPADANSTNDTAVAGRTIFVSSTSFGQGARRELRVGTDAGEVRFRLDGPGTGSVTLDPQGRLLVTITDSTDRTQLRIVGPRHAPNPPDVFMLDVRGSLKKLHAQNVDLTGTFTVSGGIKEIDADDAAGLAMSFGGSRIHRITFDDVSDSSILTPASIDTLRADRWLDTDATPDTLSAAWMAKAESRGDFALSLILSGRPGGQPVLDKVQVKGALTGDIIAVGRVGQIQADAIRSSRIIISGDLAMLLAKGDIADSTIAAANIRKADLKRGIADSHIAAGASFTDAQGVFAGTAQVAWTPGHIRELLVRRDAARSTFTAGVNPVNATWLDGDDQFASDPQDPSRLGRFQTIRFHGDLIQSRLAAQQFPAQAMVAGSLIHTAGDPRFITTL